MKYVKLPIQDSLFDPPYRYIFDANVIFAQNPENQPYPRTVWEEMWRQIDDLVVKEEIVTCGQIAKEVPDRGDLAYKWLQTCGMKIIEENDSIQQTVKRIVNEHPNMLKFNRVTNTSSGDAFLIATAIEHKLIIVTQEGKTSPIKIPQIAACYGVKSVNIAEFCELEGWKF